MAGHPHRNTANKVHKDNNDAGNNVTFDKLHRTVKGTVKLAFPFQYASPFARSIRINNTGLQIGINTHLFTGHTIQRKSGRDFRDTF